jgi:ABC-2 type transport system ATP-binding protein
MIPALEIRGLHKAYKNFALQNVSFALEPGTIMGLVGPNGAGKTTIIKLILGMIRPSEGAIRVFGLDIPRHDAEIKRRIGFVQETPTLVEDALLRDIKAAVAPFYPKWDDLRFSSLAADFGLTMNKKFKTLSHGQKMKFQLALALCHDADLLILDEPTSGLDPVFRRELLERLSDVIQDERKAVLFSTHITSDLESTADMITFIQRGKVVFSLPKDGIRDAWAVVKGGTELETGARPGLFRIIRRNPYGVEALTSDIPAVRAAFPSGIVIDRASIEDIMVFMGSGDSHVEIHP